MQLVFRSDDQQAAIRGQVQPRVEHGQPPGSGDPSRSPRLRPPALGSRGTDHQAYPSARRALVHRGPRRKARAGPDGPDADMGKGGAGCVGERRRRDGWPR